MLFRGSFYRLITQNSYLIAGLLLGLYISSWLSTEFDRNCNSELNSTPILQSKSTNQPIQAKNQPSIKKSTTSAGKKSKLIRPRYYSTELGIREKLFVGVFTSEEKINTLATHLNKTSGHLVDKIKFFITAQYKLKTKFNYTGIVGFTDTRHKYRPFQVIKYIGDNFPQDYDYYFLINDFTYFDSYKLNDIIAKISVSMDVYFGNRVKDGSYCNLDSGIILSNSVIKAMREHLDWCVINAVTDDHSENLGRCVYHSIGLACQETIQQQTLKTYRIRHFSMTDHLNELSKLSEFNKAVTIFPVTQPDDFYILNAYFLRKRLDWIYGQVRKLERDLTDVWPPGQRPGAKASTRFDLPRTTHFNATHSFLPEDFSTVRKHSTIESEELDAIVAEVKSFSSRKYSQQLQYRRLVDGYRTFDLSRGLDYVLDLGYRDVTTGKEVIKRFQVAKPLGRVEFVAAPYVTETTRITVVFPIAENQVHQLHEFFTSYTNLIIDKKEKVTLLLVLVYKNESSSSGDGDVFKAAKSFVVTTTEKHRNEDIKVAWVSVRLPPATDDAVNANAALEFAYIDLALKKIGLDSLVLVLDVNANFTLDFLNRVRMNTIEGFQIFSPIPFRQYSPEISQISHLEINKNSGHFDREEFRYISFYSRDYVTARKKYQKVPIIRVDNDIVNIMESRYFKFGNVFEMFVEKGGDLHCMRATEMGLKVKYHLESNMERCNWFLGNEQQLARLFLLKKEEIPEFF